MKYIKELHSDTYRRAAKKAKEYGQENLSKSFDDWAHKTKWKKRVKENIELKIREEYSPFKMFIHTANFSEYGEVKVGKIVDMYINDFTDMGDGESYSTLWYSPELDEFSEDDSDFVLMKTDIHDNGVIKDLISPKNRFVGRREALRFIEFLKKMYTVQSPEFMNYHKKLNDINVEKEDRSGKFYNFINDNFGSWEDFRNKLNLRKLYDRY